MKLNMTILELVLLKRVEFITIIVCIIKRMLEIKNWIFLLHKL
jgi:hypothetical protein